MTAAINSPEAPSASPETLISALKRVHAFQALQRDIAHLESRRHPYDELRTMRCRLTILESGNRGHGHWTLPSQVLGPDPVVFGGITQLYGIH